MNIKKWINNNKSKLLIAGPCSAENEFQINKIANEIDRNKIQIFRAGIWKPRSSPKDFQGIGNIGLSWLNKIKYKYNILTAIEIGNKNQAKLALENDIDVLWIGARSTSNPFLLEEISDILKSTSKLILLKNPINPDLKLWLGAIERLKNKNINNIGLIHRGFSVYNTSPYRNQPLWDIPIEIKKITDLPLICDPSHICGNRKNIKKIIKKALELKYDGFMIETHYEPNIALSDSSQQITPKYLNHLIEYIENYKIGSTHNLINMIRDDINEIDNQIIELINRRLNISKKIGQLKKDNNISVFQKKRWKYIENKYNTKIQNKNMKFKKKLLKLLHEESIKLQE